MYIQHLLEHASIKSETMEHAVIKSEGYIHTVKALYTSIGTVLQLQNRAIIG